MFNPHYRDNSNSTGAAFMEVVQQRTDASRSTRPVPAVFMPLRRTHLSGSITGPVARLTLEHEFGHPEGEEWPVLEAVYRFPLPGDSAVTGVQVRFGETEIHAALADRVEAEREYDEARATGRQAILLTRESPDVFSLHVTGIHAGQDVTVSTDYVQLCRPKGAGFQIRVPLTPAPRFSDRSDVHRRHSEGQPLAVTHDPGHRFSLELFLEAVELVESASHDLTIEERDEDVRLTLKNGEVLPDRDLVISWNQPQKSGRTSLQVMHCQDGSGDESASAEYFLSLISPPLNPEEHLEQPREVILLVDRSGSMSGAKWQAADWAVQRFLSGLNPYDSFSIGLFHSDTRWFAHECLSATQENVASARRFIAANTDSGGTRLELALREALDCGRTRGNRSRHVVIITDAQVSDSAGILELAREESKRDDYRRISVLCIDAAPNAHLVHELVALGSGRANFLTSDPEEGDITTALDELLSFWDEPVESGLTLVVNRPDAWVMGRSVADSENQDDSSRIDLGDLAAGQTVWIAGRTPATGSPLTFQLERSSGEVIATTSSIASRNSAIGKLFGARRLMALEYQLESIGTGSVRRRTRVQSSDRSRENLRDLLVAESLRFGLACSETAFVALRQEAGRIVQRGAVVPNALPHGWDDGFASYSDAPVLASRMDVETFSESLSEPRDFSANTVYYQERQYPASMDLSRQRDSVTLFTGVPPSSELPVVLYEDEGFGRRGRLVALRITVDGFDDGTFDGVLELYLGTSEEPRASMRLRDVLRQQGLRPLNVRVRYGLSLRLVLREVTGGAHPPPMTIEVELA